MKHVFYMTLIIGLLITSFLQTLSDTQIEPAMAAPAPRQDTILTLAVPEYQQPLLREDILTQFEAMHPGVKIQLVDNPGNPIPPVWNMEAYLDETTELVTRADVLWVNGYHILPEATRAGYFMDLMPLVNNDLAFNADDFFPAAWESYQWEGHMWALPTGILPVLLMYDAAQFDAAGVNYPHGGWTLTDFVQATRALVEYDGNGQVAVPGFLADNNETPLLIRALAGSNYYDDSTGEIIPRFNFPELETVIATLAPLQESQVINGIQFGGTREDVPMFLSNYPHQYFQDTDFVISREASLLPGNVAPLIIDGFAVSNGTANPELAYELVKFLTLNQDFLTAHTSGGGRFPAQKVIMETQRSGYEQMYTPEKVALLERAIENGLPVSDWLYAEYINLFSATWDEPGVEITSALQEIEQEIQANLDHATSLQGTNPLAVTSSQPVELAPGEIALNFNYQSFVSPIPNEEAWQRLIDDFVATDPEVGAVNFNTEGWIAPEDMAERYDCFYGIYRPDTLSTLMEGDLVLSLAPLTGADMNFDRNDFMNGVLEQLTHQNHLMAYPVGLEMNAFWYDARLFTDAGYAEPTSGWTIQEFNQALVDFYNGEPVFRSMGVAGTEITYLPMLMAAYGVLPIDYRNDPPTINFTDPATIEGIRQVLDMARNGYIDYQSLINPEYSGTASTAPMFNMPVDAFSATWFDSSEMPYRSIPFPEGVYTPLSYRMGVAYISANTQNPAACYRLIETISQRPDLLGFMPARNSQLNDSAITTTYAPQIAELYQAFATQMQQPNAVVIPAGSFENMAFEDYRLQYWLNRAFDQYVLEGADLQQALTEAERLTLEFQTCVESIPPQDNVSMNREINRCATQVDPELAQN